MTNADKSCLLVEAMADDKARQHAEAAIAHTTTYEEAVKILKRHYEDNRLLFCHHYNELHQPDIFKDTVEDLDRLEDRLNAGVRGLESSNGYPASQLLVAALERMMSPGLSRQWKQYSHELQDPPPAEKLLAFVEWQMKSAPDSRLTSLKMEKQNWSKGQPTTRKSAFQLQESVKNSEAHKVKCHYCNEDHSIFMCSGFKTLSLNEKLDKIRSKHLWYNCLGVDDSSAQCSSKRHCKKCKGRHHTFIHKDTPPPPPPCLRKLLKILPQPQALPLRPPVRSNNLVVVASHAQFRQLPWLGLTTTGVEPNLTLEPCCP